MNEKFTIKPYEYFSWIATIIGFIVDTIALLGLFSAFRLEGIVADQVNFEFPKIHLGYISIKWKDATFVIFIYLTIAIVFFVREKLIKNDVIDTEEHELNILISFFAFNFLLFTLFLWLAVFILYNLIYPYFYSILLFWAISLLFSVNFIRAYWVKRSTTIFKYMARLGLAYIAILPILTLLVEFLTSPSFFTALELVLRWFLTVILYSTISQFLWILFLSGIRNANSWYKRHIKSIW